MSLIFIGDIHQNWHHVEAGLATLHSAPRTAILLGDVECTEPLDHLAAPLLDRGIEVHWIHGNHDYDTGPDMWANMADAARNPLTAGGALHGRVTEIGGLRVAGLGGAFLPLVWRGNIPPRLHRRAQLRDELPPSRPDLDADGLASLAHFLGAIAIWPEDVEALATQQADVLVTHEAPSSHPGGFAVLDELARRMGARLIVHGHHHVTTMSRAEDGLRAVSVGDTWAVGLEGDVVWRGRRRDRPLPRTVAGWAVEPVAG